MGRGNNCVSLVLWGDSVFLTHFNILYTGYVLEIMEVLSEVLFVNMALSCRAPRS